MKFVRTIANSNILVNVLDIPEELRNKKVEIIILPYDNSDNLNLKDHNKKRMFGTLEKYKNKELRNKENEAWANATVENHENS